MCKTELNNNEGNMKMKTAATLLSVITCLTAGTHVVSNSTELDAAVADLVSGDTLFLNGGNYSTEIQLSDLDNITISSSFGNRAVIDGTVPITSEWSSHSSSIYKTKLNQPIWQLFIDGVQQTGARWPNARYSDNSVFNQSENWAKTESSSNGQFIDPNLPALDLTGAVAVLNCGSFRSYAAKVKQNSASSLTHDNVPNHKGGSFYYFLDSHLDLLDAEEEWFFDPTDSTLYVWGDPSSKDIRGKTQSYAITLENCDNVNIENLDFFATAFQATRSKSLTVSGNRFSFPATNRRMLKDTASPEVISIYAVSSDNFIFRNNILEYTDGEGLYTEGTNATIENNYMHTLDYTATSRRGLSVTFWLKGTGLLFTGNTIHNTGSSEMLVGGTKSKLSYNHIWNTGHVQNDGAIFQMTKNNVEDSEIHHNWLHDTPKYAIRFDAPAGEAGLAGKFGKVHHNVLWNCPKAMMIKGDNHHIYNNTVFNSTGNDMIILDEDNGNSETHTFNNLVQKMGAHRVKSVQEYPTPGTVTSNYNGYSKETPVVELIPNWNEFDFSSSSEELHEKGTIINGLPLEFSGTNPDIGAYENGGELWKPGTTLDTARLSPWPWSLSGESNVAIGKTPEKVKMGIISKENRNITLSGFSSGSIAVEIFAVNGRELFSESVYSSNGFASVEVPANIKGVVVMKIRTEAAMFSQKMLF